MLCVSPAQKSDCVHFQRPAEAYGRCPDPDERGSVDVDTKLPIELVRHCSDGSVPLAMSCRARVDDVRRTHKT